MARTVKEYDERRAEFLEVAQKLFYSRGYERTSVRQIIDAVGVAKGTFYHYFDSKSELLDALVEALVEDLYEQMLSTLEPALADGTIGAAEKLEILFAHAGAWKAANRGYLLESVRVFYQDENVLLRTKMTAVARQRTAPLLARIVRQGVEEGVFDVAYPEEAARLVLSMNQDVSEAVVSSLLGGEGDEAVLERIERKLLTYEQSVQRVLGAAAGSLQLVDPAQIEVWFLEDDDKKNGPIDPPVFIKRDNDDRLRN